MYLQGAIGIVQNVETLTVENLHNIGTRAKVIHLEKNPQDVSQKTLCTPTQ